jgi:hypothetical protein
LATILTDDGPVAVGTLTALTEAELRSVTGFELRPEGLCRADVCVPTHARPDLRTGDGVDARVVAELLGRPLAVDDATGDAVLAASATARAEAGASVADLVLSDLDGEPFAWSCLGRKKKVLVAWASW